jgi:hypothetical protein
MWDIVYGIYPDKVAKWLELFTKDESCFRDNSQTTWNDMIYERLWCKEYVGLDMVFKRSPGG